MNRLTHRRATLMLYALSLPVFAQLPTLAFARQSASVESPEISKSKDRKIRPDLADTVVGTYTGDVISDSQGSSKPGVTLYVTKVNKSSVRVASDYARLPIVEVPIAVYSNQVLATRGTAVFVLNRNKSPQTLDFNPDGSVSFAGVRQE
jgi:hypothetical protein